MLGGIFSKRHEVLTLMEEWRDFGGKTQVLTPSQNQVWFEIPSQLSGTTRIFPLNPPYLWGLPKTCHLCFTHWKSGKTSLFKKSKAVRRNNSSKDMKRSNSFFRVTGKSFLFSRNNIFRCKPLLSTIFFKRQFWNLWSVKKNSFCVRRLVKNFKTSNKSQNSEKNFQTTANRKFAIFFC